MTRRWELRTILRAITQGWPMPEAELLKAIDLANEVLKDDNASSREVLSAGKIIVALDRLASKVKNAANEQLNGTK